MKKLLGSKVRLLLVALSLVIVMLAATVGVYASGILATETISGMGTITILVRVPPNYSIALYSDAACTVPLTSLDFSGDVDSGNGYTKTIQVYIKNTGTNGTNGGASARIDKISIEGQGLPDGWTVTTTLYNPILAGQSFQIPITISSNGVPLTEDVTLESFDIIVNAY